jgi:hypothetical protein
MNWSKQDSYTFLIGLGAAVLMVIGEALVRSQELADDPAKWGLGLATGVMAAAGRYLVTELTQRGLGPKRKERNDERKPRRNRPRATPP